MEANDVDQNSWTSDTDTDVLSSRTIRDPARDAERENDRVERQLEGKRREQDPWRRARAEAEARIAAEADRPDERERMHDQMWCEKREAEPGSRDDPPEFLRPGGEPGEARRTSQREPEPEEPRQQGFEGEETILLSKGHLQQAVEPDPREGRPDLVRHGEEPGEARRARRERPEPAEPQPQAPAATESAEMSGTVTTEPETPRDGLNRIVVGAVAALTVVAGVAAFLLFFQPSPYTPDRSTYSKTVLSPEQPEAVRVEKTFTTVEPASAKEQQEESNRPANRREQRRRARKRRAPSSTSSNGGDLTAGETESNTSNRCYEARNLMAA